jgi:hypothetical protein
MAIYLAVHTPLEAEDDSVHQPTDLHGLALKAGDKSASPRWLKAWSPDLHDERIFTMWEADNAESIINILKRFGFLDNMETKAFQVTEWGPDTVLGGNPSAS